MNISLHQLIQYIILFFSINTLANTNDISHNFNIKDIYKTITCDDCCFPVANKSCLIFYVLCKTKTYFDGIFLLSNNKITDFSNISDMQHLNRVVFIIPDKVISFESIKHHNLLLETLNNIEKMKAEGIKSNEQIYDTNYDIIELNLEKEGKVRKPLPHFFVADVKFEKAHNALNSYNDLITSKLNNNTIDIFNLNQTVNCKAQGNNISTFQATIAPTNENNDIDIKLIVGVVLGSIVFIMLPIIIYKIYQKKNKSTNTKKSNPPIKENQDSNTMNKEHIYEEINDFPTAGNSTESYDKVGGFIPSKYDDDIIVVYHPQLEHHNKQYDNINLSATCDTSNNKTVDDLSDYNNESKNQISISTNSENNILQPNEQEDNSKQTDSIKSHYYHILEENNDTNNNKYHHYQPLIKPDNSTNYIDIVSEK